jgi:hypothetical protein
MLLQGIRIPIFIIFVSSLSVSLYRLSKPRNPSLGKPTNQGRSSPSLISLSSLSQQNLVTGALAGLIYFNTAFTADASLPL